MAIIVTTRTSLKQEINMVIIVMYISKVTSLHGHHRNVHR